MQSRTASGYRRFYFDRIDSVLPEALAWQPQATVAIVINKIWQILFDEQSRIQVLLQVHDSLAGQFPTIVYDESIEAIRGAARRVIVPYPIPLCIPLGIKTSDDIVGDCA